MKSVLVENPRVKPGDKFGKLVVAGRAFYSYRKNTNKKRMDQLVVVHCECGNVSAVSVENILRPKTQSCGCIAKTQNGLVSKERRLRRIWGHIIDRCYRPNCIQFKDYGARGITACDEWRDSFEAFVKWAKANGYSPELEIDRINNNRGYSPDNCRWTTRTRNMRNTRRTVFLTAFGETKAIGDWAEDQRCVCRLGTLARRIRDGWNTENALTITAVIGSNQATFSTR